MDEELLKKFRESWTQPSLLKEIPSENVYCAYIDILGLRDALHKWKGALNVYFDTMKQVLSQATFYNIVAETDTKAREIYVKSDERTERYFKKDDLATHVKVMVLSDAIVITASRLEDVLIVAARSYKLCLENRIPVRGYISYGRHLHVHLGDNQLVVSTALRDAYEGESKIAKYPRVVVNRDLVSKWAYKNPTIFVQDQDDQWFLNPFFESFSSAAAKKIFSFTRGALKKHKNNPRVLEKYSWLADYLNAYTFSDRVKEPWFYYSESNFREKLRDVPLPKGGNPGVRALEIWNYTDGIGRRFVFPVSLLYRKNRGGGTTWYRAGQNFSQPKTSYSTSFQYNWLGICVTISQFPNWPLGSGTRDEFLRTTQFTGGIGRQVIF